MTLADIAEWHAKMAEIERDEQFAHFHRQAAETLLRHRSDVRLYTQDEVRTLMTQAVLEYLGGQKGLSALNDAVERMLHDFEPETPKAG